MQTQSAEGEILSLNLTPEGLRLSTARWRQHLARCYPML
jgi:hypothetical protein